MSDFNMEEYAKAFLDEATDLLEQANDDVLKIEVEPDDETLNSLFRSIHTIKGSAGGFGFDHISEFSHHLETLLDKLRSKELEVTSDIVDVILEGIDIISEMVNAAKDEEEYNVDTDEYIKKIKRLLNEEVSEEEKEEEDITNTVQNFDIYIDDLDEDVKKWIEDSKGDKNFLYKIKLNIDSDYLENGYDILPFIKNLNSSSDNVLVKADWDNIPEIRELNPYELYIKPEIYCFTDLSVEEIKDLFFEPDLVEIQVVGLEKRPSEKQDEKESLIEKDMIDVSDVDKDSLQELKESVEDYFVELENTLINIEKNKSAKDEEVNELFRVFHNIKGDAGYVGFKFLSNYAHLVESLLDKIRNKKLIFDDKAATIILKAIDDFKEIIDLAIESKDIVVPITFKYLQKIADINLEDGEKDVEAEGIEVFWQQIEQMLELIDIATEGEKIDNTILNRALTGMRNAAKFMKFDDFIKVIEQAEADFNEGKVDEGVGKIRKYIDELKSPPKKLGEILIEEGIISEEDLNEVLQEQKPIGKLLVEKGKVDEEKVETALKKQKVMEKGFQKELEHKTEDTKKHIPKTVKIDQTKIDKFTNTIGEMIVAKNSYEYLVSKLITDFNLPANIIKEFKDNIYLISRIAQDLQSDIMSLRMVPIKQIFQKFPRVVRDISKKYNKRIELVTIGEETEIDKNVADALNDPLIHIVRNACDHGIETPEERIAKNKPEYGTLILKAYQEGSFVYIEISDDGRGIDAEKVRKKAIERGLLTENMEMSEEEIIKLIFEPGFSTAEKVTDVSGRGVGMDVVKTSIESIGGSIDIKTEKDHGTRIILKIPMNFGVTTTLLIEHNDEEYGIPIENIIETLKIPKEKVKDVHYGYGIYYRDRILPVFNLGDILGEESKMNEEEVSIVVIKTDNYRFGLIVDRYKNIIDVAVKPVPKFLANLSFIGGITILGSGKTVILLNPNKLLDEVNA